MESRCKNTAEVIWAACEKFPSNVAVEEDGRPIFTYSQLWEKAMGIAVYLKVIDVDIVCIDIDKSAAYIASLLGCWIAGKAFVPIGGDIPDVRKKFIVEQCSPCSVLDAALYGRISGGSTEIESVSVDSPAYIIFSSGTTGAPKGIVVSHSGLENLIECQVVAFGLDEKSRFLHFLSINFDASLSDILTTLASGATLVIETMAKQELAANILSVVNRLNITHTDIPPSLVKLLDCKLKPKSLRTIVIGGEKADISTVREWSSVLNLVNVYGPTEATICTSLCQCTPQWDKPLIGNEIKGVFYSIRNSEGVESDEGELFISGKCLALGYLKNDALTQKKFPVIDGIRYYKTGDYVRRIEKGIEFLSRIDRQVKIRGQLVEPEEIETVLNSLSFVQKSAVIKNSSGKLSAFVVLDGEKKNYSSIIRRSLEKSLPPWMVPSQIVFVDAMPLTPSGKTNYEQLGRYVVNHCNSDIYQNSIEKDIAKQMSDTLMMPSVAPEDNFFDLGADSLDCVVLLSQLERALGISISLETLKKNPSPRMLSRISDNDDSMAMKSDSFQSDWSIPFTSCLYTATAAESVLITGATGFLGSRILTQITSDFPEKKVYCLVRSKTPQEGRSRVLEAIRRYNPNNHSEICFEVVCGDVSKKLLGLTEELFSGLSCEISEVFHCAAEVNMLESFHKLKPCNVDGVANILDFCINGCKKSLHYASTLSVFVATDFSTGLAMESDRLEYPTTIYGGYGQTKYVAEKILFGVPKGLCDIFIYRFGLLCGDSVNGIASDKDFFTMFVKGAKKTGVLPASCGYELLVDITPIDKAVTIAMEIYRSKCPGTYHIASENPLSYNDLCNIMIKEKTIDRLCSANEWKAFLLRFANDSEVQATGMALCRLDDGLFKKFRYFDLFQTTGIRFDMTNTHRIAKTRCFCNEELIKLYLNKL